ncbi:MAG: metallophosphoesterase [Thermodesulfobacteriota bacterium]|nr:metallophosphoesterase [Thermodesulfobacteriota bacterium]
MLIYAVADIHGRCDRIALIGNKVLKHRPDVLVVAGDITNYIRPEPVIAELNDIPAPVLTIRGNSDLNRVEKLFDKYPNIFPLHLKEIVVDGISFTGVSGTMPVPFSSLISFREKHVIDRLRLFVKRDTVLVAHPPPRGTLDEVLGRFHAGCRRLQKIVVNTQPRLLICGHIHERPGALFVGETLVVNCSMGRKGAGILISLNKGMPPEAELI